jgi:hypothetical protein
MKLAVTLASLIIAAAGCGSTSDVAADPGAGGGSVGRPTSIPAADGPVTGMGTVIGGDQPQLCLGAVAESWPPQCSGFPIVGWDWSAVKGTFDTNGTIKWGSYVVAGTWDGATFTLTRPAKSAATYDPMMPPSRTALPAVAHTQAELIDIQAELPGLPGYSSGWVDPAGFVRADFVYDDGSIQAWLDQEYGENVVMVVSALTQV